MQKEPDKAMTESKHSKSVHKSSDKETEVLARTEISNNKKTRSRGLLQLTEGNGKTMAKKKKTTFLNS